MSPVHLALPESALQRGFRGSSCRLEDFSRLGNFAIGALPNDNGLFTQCGNTFWRADPDQCMAHPIPHAESLLTGVTVSFTAETEEDVDCPAGANQFVSMIARMTPSPNYAYAVQIHGLFTHMRISPSPYYGPLLDLPGDRLIHLEQVEGALLGFYFPPLLQDVAWGGYRFHFLSADHTRTGRLVDCEIEKPRVALQHLDECRIALPQTPDFQMTDFLE